MQQKHQEELQKAKEILASDYEKKFVSFDAV